MLMDEQGALPWGDRAPTHALMGRFGNVMMVNGETDYRLEARRGEVVRFYLTNVANSRTFNVTFGGARSTWEGRVTRMEAQVDQASRMVHVVVEVKDPYDTSENRPALLPGTFVDVQIFGRTLEGVVPVPRFAVHEGDQVWLFDDGKLAIRRVRALRSDRHQTLVASGIDDGDLVIVSPLDAVTDGMAVRNAAEQVDLTDGVPGSGASPPRSRRSGSPPEKR